MCLADYICVEHHKQELRITMEKIVIINVAHNILLIARPTVELRASSTAISIK